MSGCERCEERGEQETILAGMEELRKKETSCLSSKNVDDPQFKEFYDFAKNYSKQLKDCLLSGVSFQERMLKLYDELKGCDMVRDHGKIVRIIREILDIARMQETNASVTKKTAEMLEERMSGTH